MKTLRSLAVLFLLVFAAIGSSPLLVQAEEEAPEPPGPDCVWSGASSIGGIWYGAYNCSWGCTYTYRYSGGSWSQTGQSCGGGDLE